MTTLIRRILNSSSSLRYLSTASKLKILKGTNGEQIIYSPYEDVIFPEITLPEYVWKDVNKHNNKIAVECGVTGRKYTYGQARDNSNYLARSLLQLGIKSGDVVAIILPNLPETAIAFLGCLEADAIVTTVNPNYTVSEISKQISTCNVKAIITAAEIASDVAMAAKSVLLQNIPLIAVDDGTRTIPSGVIHFNDLITKGKSLPQVPPSSRSPHDVALLPFSSGTTGLPKGVMLSHLNLVANMEMFASITKGDFVQMTDEVQEIVPAVLPLFHIFGMNCTLFPRLAEGSKIITIPKFTAETYVSVLENHKPTGLILVPPILLFLTSSEIVKKHHMNSVRYIISGAAPLSNTDVERFMDKFQKPINCGQGYGLTESSPVAFFEKSGKKYSSIGQPVSNCRVRLVDVETKKDITETGKSGELWIAGPHVMKGYYNNEKATKETIENGWLKTGDISHFDDNGDFFISDRLKELIKVKGFQVAPAELEALLRTHPAIDEAAVIGVPDARRGEVPRAFVRLKKDKTTSEEDIKNFMKGKVSDFKELKGGVTFIDDIPKNTTGKILRSKLKQQYVK